METLDAIDAFLKTNLLPFISGAIIMGVFFLFNYIRLRDEMEYLQADNKWLIKQRKNLRQQLKNQTDGISQSEH